MENLDTCNCGGIDHPIHEVESQQATPFIFTPVTFAKAAITHVVSGEKSSLEEHTRRISICEGCDKNKMWFCEVCKCVLFIKASWNEQKCPLGKW